MFLCQDDGQRATDGERYLFMCLAVDHMLRE